MPYAFEGGICTDARDDAISITEEQYAAALEGIVSGLAVSIVGGFKLIEPPADEEPDPEENMTLDQWKLKLSIKIDQDAEHSRLRYITGGSGQAMTYQQKAQEAADALKATDPAPEDYPLLAGEIGITGSTLIEVATVINGAYQSWRVVGATIEALRLGGKAVVASASSIVAAKLAADIEWP